MNFRCCFKLQGFQNPERTNGASFLKPFPVPWEEAAAKDKTKKGFKKCAIYPMFILPAT
jgi:hypothetical protein